MVAGYFGVWTPPPFTLWPFVAPTLVTATTFPRLPGTAEGSCRGGSDPERKAVVWDQGHEKGQRAMNDRGIGHRIYH